MSRDMCPHGFDLREDFCVGCASPEQLRQQVGGLTMRLEELELQHVALAKDREAELDALRLIVTEKFAGADMYVKPEDAADLANWAAHPEAVRELLRRTPIAIDDDSYCPDCGSGVYESHGQFFDQKLRCRVAEAWHTLGDPRAAEDVERAREEALRESARRSRPGPRTGGWVGEVRGLSEAEQIALYGHVVSTPYPRMPLVEMRTMGPIAVDPVRAGDLVALRVGAPPLGVALNSAQPGHVLDIQTSGIAHVGEALVVVSAYTDGVADVAAYMATRPEDRR